MKKLTEKVKPFYKSKTVLLGIATMVLAGLEFWRENTVSPNSMAIIGILIIGLRFMTSSKLSIKSQ